MDYEAGEQRKSLAAALAAICTALSALSGFDARAETDKPDIVIDGVPLPGDVAPLERMPAGVAADKRLTGTWVGSWGGSLKTILVIESAEPDGTAQVVYAIGSYPAWRIPRLRRPGPVRRIPGAGRQRPRRHAVSPSVGRARSNAISVR